LKKLFFSFLSNSSGYVPQRKYQHGNRYRIETDACTTSTKATYEKGRRKEKDLLRTINSYPKTKGLNSGTVLQHFLDYYRAYHPTDYSQGGISENFRNEIILVCNIADRRPFTEGPIPGYKGYVPRVIPIGAGLGAPYKEAARKGLYRFAVETTNSMTNFPPSFDNQPLLSDYAKRSK
jgi:hypothetical protein